MLDCATAVQGERGGLWKATKIISAKLSVFNLFKYSFSFRKKKVYVIVTSIIYDNYVIICFSIIIYVFESIMIFFHELYYTIEKKNFITIFLYK